MLKTVWGVNYVKYVTTEGIQCCQKKAMILPANWEVYINNSIDSATITESHKVVSMELCNE